MEIPKTIKILKKKMTYVETSYEDIKRGMF